MKGGEIVFPFRDDKEYLITLRDPNKGPINGVFNSRDGPFLVFSYYNERNQLDEFRLRVDEQFRLDDENVTKIEPINIVRGVTYKIKFKDNRPDRISKYIGRFDEQNNYYFIDLKGTHKVSDNFLDLEGIPVKVKEPEYRIRYKPSVTDDKQRQPRDLTVRLQRIIEGEEGRRFFIFENDEREFTAVDSDFSQLEYEPVKVGGKRRTIRKRAVSKKRRRSFKKYAH